jgi:hypothetical protein
MDERQRLANCFHEDMREGIRTLSWDIGYRPPQFTEVLGRCGAVEAARRALSGPRMSEGFLLLARHGLLHRSVEAWVLRPEYADLFTGDERAEARRRLEDHGFPVDAYVHALTQPAQA